MYRRFIDSGGAAGRWNLSTHHLGRKPKFSEAIRQQLRGWLQQWPDLTRAELQEKLRQQAQLGVSQPALWVVLRKMGLRPKKVTACART